MSSWTSRVLEHNAWTVLAELRDEASNLSESGTLDAVDTDHLNRLEAVLARIGQWRDALDPIVSSTVPLDTVAQRLDSARQEVSNYLSNENVQHLVNANSHADSALIAMTQLPRIETQFDIETLQESVVSYRRALGQHLRYADEEVGQLKSLVQSLSDAVRASTQDVDAQKARLDQAITAFQEQFSRAQSERQEKVQELLGTLAELEQSQQAAFLTSESSRQEVFEASQSDLSDRFDAALAGAESAHQTALSKADKATEAALERLKAQEAEAKRIVGAVSQTGMAGGFQQVANREKRQMWFWQGLTVVAFVGFIAVVAGVLPDVGTGNNWPAFAQRALVSLGFGALAAFGARESAKHAEKERRNRRLELDIASIGPFLSALPTEKQNELREQVAERVFGREVTPLGLQEVNLPANSLVDMLNMVLKELLKKT